MSLEAFQEFPFDIVQRVDAFSPFVEAFLIIDFPFFEHAPRGLQSGNDRASDPSLQSRLDEARSTRFLVKFPGKFLSDLQCLPHAVG